MADSKGNDTNPADTRTGPVKPPVLDLKARPTQSAETGPAETTKVDAEPAPNAQPRAGAGPAIGAAVAGGVIGLAAAYGLALAGLWPSVAVAPAPSDPRLAQFASAIPELETVTQTTQSELAALNQRIAAIENAEPATPVAPADLTSVEADIAALGTRIDTLGAAQPATDTAALDELRSTVSAISTRLDEMAARVGTAEAGLRNLDTTLSKTNATLAEQPTDIGAVLQLPLILSGLETAFANGRPYETELAALRAAVPKATIPTLIANAAATGLARPDAIARRFDAVLPDIIAGRPANPDAQWQDGAVDWFASVIALRPTGEIEGDTPDAVVSRLVGAIERRDFVEAETLLASLPAPMQTAAGDVPALIAVQAEAARFLESLRTEAIAGGAAQ